MNEFLLGVVSSLVATFLIYISRHVWQKWWHLLLSRNYPDVSGKYKLIEIVNPVLTTPWYPDEKVFCKIKQFGNALTGTLEIFSGDEKKLAFRKLCKTQPTAAC